MRSVDFDPAAEAAKYLAEKETRKAPALNPMAARTGFFDLGELLEALIERRNVLAKKAGVSIEVVFMDQIANLNASVPCHVVDARPRLEQYRNPEYFRKGTTHVPSELLLPDLIKEGNISLEEPPRSAAAAQRYTGPDPTTEVAVKQVLNRIIENRENELDTSLRALSALLPQGKKSEVLMAYCEHVVKMQLSIERHSTMASNVDQQHQRREALNGLPHLVKLDPKGWGLA